MTADLVATFRALWADGQKDLAEVCEVAAQLRDVGQPIGVASVGDLHAALVQMRGNLDRIEEISTNLNRIRARARMAVNLAKDAYDDARQYAITHTTPVEYTTAEERSATYDMKALTERARWRRMRNIEAEVSEAAEYVRSLQFGLDSARRDIGTRFAMLNFEDRLERS